MSIFMTLPVTSDIEMFVFVIFAVGHVYVYYVFKGFVAVNINTVNFHDVTSNW